MHCRPKRANSQLLLWLAVCMGGGAGFFSPQTAWGVGGAGYTFGFNFQGMSGMGSTSGLNPMATPINTSNLGALKITQVDAGNLNSLVLTEDGRAFSFGENLDGKTGLGITSSVTAVATPIDTSNLGSLKVTQVSMNLRGLVLAEDGSVFSFGSNASGVTGLGTTSGDTLVATPIVTSNLGARKITQVAAGLHHSLVLAEDGSVFSFGGNTNGQTGLGTTIGDTLVATPINTSNLGALRITQVDAGGSNSLLMAEDGSVFSFGTNANGRTGQGTTIGDTLVATPIDTSYLGSLKITQLAAGSSHCLLLAEDGSVFSFGSNANGRTGLGTTIGDTLVATPIDTSYLGGLKITQVAAGRDHSLLLTEDGSVFSFGINTSGAVLGRIGSAIVAMPIDTTNLVGKVVTDISAGASYSLVVAGPRYPGDYNNNGLVDAADYVLWRKTLGRIAGRCPMTSTACSVSVA